MKKLFCSLLATVGLLGASLTAATPAVAQIAAPPGSVTCEAVSGYAVGVWTGWNLDQACNQAMYQCRIRTPYFATCYINRYWFN